MNLNLGNSPEASRDSCHVEGFKVDLDISQLQGNYPADLTSFYQSAAGIIPPGEKRYFKIKVIKDNLASKLKVKMGTIPIVTATVSIVGKYSGADIEYCPYVYPIGICEGCLVDFRAICPDPTSDKSIYECTCGLCLQDGPVICCLDPQKGRRCFKITGP